MATSPHVLVVEDARTDHINVSRVLRCFHNIQVTSMDSPQEALGFLSTANNVKLILTDYHVIHGMSGYDLFREVKESHELKHIPVMMVFLDENREEVKRCLDGGVKAHIFKPIQVTDVAFIMRHI